jgi:hypothetical protein
LPDEHAQLAPGLMAIDDYQWAEPLSLGRRQIAASRTAGTASAG